MTQFGYRLSSQQTLIWGCTANEENKNNTAALVEVLGTIDLASLEFRLNKICQQQEILRTWFVQSEKSEQPLQVIADATQFAIEVFEPAHQAPPDSKEQIIEQMWQQNVDSVFAPNSGAALKVLYHQLDTGSVLLLLVLPSLRADLSSVIMMIENLLSHSGAEDAIDPPIQYADYAQWQVDILEEEESVQAKAYWQNSVKNWSQPSSTLPFFKPDSTAFTTQKTVVPMPEGLAKALSHLSTELSIDTEQLLLSAWLITLSRITDSQQVALSVITDDRKFSELESTLGPLQRVLPIQFELDKTLAFPDLCRTIALEIQQLSEYSQYNHIIDTPQHRQKTALPKTGFSCTSLASLPRMESCQYRLHRSWSTSIDMNIELSVVISNENEFACHLYFNGQAIEKQAVQIYSDQFSALLSDICNNPHSKLTELFSKFPDDVIEAPAANNSFEHIISSFQHRVQELPEQLALRGSGTRHLTYLELDKSSNQIAHYLRHKKDDDSPVLLLFDTGIIWLEAILAVFKTGRPYVALSNNLPKQRIALIQQITGASCAISETKTHALIDFLPCIHIRLDKDAEDIARSPHTAINTSLSGSGLAYINFTSGTSGEPKGVAVEHRQLSSYCQAVIERLELQQCQRFLHLSTFVADLGHTVLFPPLLLGGTLTIIEDERRTDATYLSKVISDEQYKIDCVKITPTHFASLLNSADSPQCLVPDKKLIFGGDTLRWELVQRIRDLNSDCQLFNHYGPSETTVGAVACLIKDIANPYHQQSVPIGVPLPGVKLKILSPERLPVRTGVAGELYIGGCQVARGYLDPQLNQQRFVCFSDGAGVAERYYKTGDKVKRLPNGDIVYLGRYDRQVKLSGYRIEMEEIESCLQGCQHIKQVTAAVLNNLQNQQNLVVFYVPAPDHTEHREALNTHLQQLLPSYVRPVCLEIASIPLTRNGKVDGKKLAQYWQDHQNSQSRTQSVINNATEQSLCDIWCKVLRIEKIGIHDNFFELGGDSIHCIRIVSLARKKNILFRPQDLQKLQTIAKLAKVCRTANKVTATQKNVSGDIPLLPIQHWFFEHRHHNIAHWNMAVLLVIPEKPDIAVLQQALDHCLKRHDALRISFTETETGWRQYNNESVTARPIRVHRLTVSDVSQQNVKLQKIIHEAQEQFQLEQAPLINVNAITIGDSWRLLVTVHHLVMDGISWRILLTSLHEVYCALLSGKPAPPHTKTTSFKQWSEKLQNYANSTTASSQLNYWQNVLANQTPIPRDSSQGDNTNDSVAIAVVRLSRENTNSLQKHLSISHHFSIKEVLTYAICYSFARYTQHSKMLLEFEGHGREDLFENTSTDNTIGWFTSRYPISIELPGGGGAGNPLSECLLALQSVKEQINAIPDNGIGYGLLRYLSKNKNSLRDFNHPEVSFNYLGSVGQTMFNTDWRMADEKVSGERHGKSHRSQLIAIEAIIIDDKLQVEWHYNKSAIKDASIGQLISHFEAALELATSLSKNDMNVGDFSPADFPDADLDQQQLNQLTRRYASKTSDSLSSTQHLLKLHAIWENIEPQFTEKLIQKFSLEEIFPLSPLQSGMLYDGIFSGDNTLYLQQKVITFGGNVNEASLKAAWKQIIRRHASLRTVFNWTQVSKPHQIVLANIPLQWQSFDWSDYGEEKLKQVLEEFLQRDKLDGFALDEPPLMRFAFCRLGDNQNFLIWSHHHMLLDGWCNNIIMKELLKLYQNVEFNQFHPLALNAPYSGYIRKIATYSPSQMRAYWQATLTDLELPVSIPAWQGKRDTTQSGTIKKTINQQQTEDLIQFARGKKLTLSHLINASWAALLHQFSGDHQVVFGMILSGRDMDLKGTEQMVGLLMNVLPLRADIDRQSTVTQWLNQLAVKQTEMMQHQACSMADIRSWIKQPPTSPLFNSAITFENYPVDDLLFDKRESIYIKSVSAPVLAQYPISIMVDQTQSLDISVSYKHFIADEIEQVTEHWLALLSSMVASSHMTVADWLTQSPSPIPMATTTKAENSEVIAAFNDDLEIDF